MIEHDAPATETTPATQQSDEPVKLEKTEAVQSVVLPTEVGGRGGLEPTRYGDWEKNGRCIDF